MYDERGIMGVYAVRWRAWPVRTTRLRPPETDYGVAGRPSTTTKKSSVFAWGYAGTEDGIALPALVRPSLSAFA